MTIGNSSHNWKLIQEVTIMKDNYTLWYDTNEGLWCVNINNGPVPDFESMDVEDCVDFIQSQVIKYQE